MSDYGTKSKKYAEAMKWRDWQTCDLICEEHKELVETIKKLEAENLELKENIQEMERLQIQLDAINESEEIEKLKAENEILNKIKQNRNELVEMNMNLQKELASTKETLSLAVFTIRHSLNSHQISCDYILNKDRKKCDCAYKMALDFLG